MTPQRLKALNDFFYSYEHLKLLLNAIFHTDVYKVTHKSMEPEGTETIYANWTPRTNKYFLRDYPDHDGKVVTFGLQAYIINELMVAWKYGFFDRPLDEVMEEINTVLGPLAGVTPDQIKHIEAVHKLGHLPVIVKAVKEGTLLPINMPMATFRNTNKDHSWTTNYIESVSSSDLWKPMTTATAAREFAKLRDLWWDKTVVDHTYKKFAIHDFAYRGHSGHWSAGACGAAPLLYSNGTDNIPGVVFARAFYEAKNDVAASVPASEHSVTTLGINYYANFALEGEIKELVEQLANRLAELKLSEEFEQAKGELITLYLFITKRYPEGVMSYVADSYDYWRVLTILLPILYPVIMRRQGKLVIRPDSGDPVDMVVGENALEQLEDLVARQVSTVPCGNTFSVNGKTYMVIGSFYQVPEGRYLPLFELLRNSFITEVETRSLDRHVVLCPEAKGSVAVLEEIFGSVANAKGYKELPPQVGLIYGDGITYKRAKAIYEGLATKMYAASNVIFGVGSYSFAGGTRDSLGFAIKATFAEVNGKPVPIYKAPKTDDGSKKSARGLLCLERGENGEIVLLQDVTPEKEATGLLEVIFENGELKRFQDFEEIRNELGWNDVVR